MTAELIRRIRGTRVDLGKKLKKKWLEASDIECEPLIFGDLRIGDRFISMPIPGDNYGHGGLLGGHYLFIKINQTGTGALPSNAVSFIRGTAAYFPNTMLVLKID